MTTPIPVPAPDAVKVFASRHMAAAARSALCESDDARREALHYRPFDSVEDRQDFEAAVARHAAATKRLATVPTRTTGGAR